MPFESWTAFAAASLVLLAIPGPTVTLVVSYAMSEGRFAAAAIALGVALGDLAAMSLSLLGLGAALTASAALFSIVKWIGALYLVWLGWRLWRAPVGTDGAIAQPPVRSLRRMAAHAFAVTLFNPKSLVFFVAFAPQFIDATRPYGAQATVMIVTFVALAFANALVYGLAAARARRALARPATARLVNRLGGGALMGAGFFAATMGGNR
jgi:threonine/homoserine/homoserine lactone efflux protein